MKRYDQIFTLEVDKTKEEILQRVQARAPKAIVTDDAITIRRYPPWYRVFAGRGSIKLDLSNSKAGGRSVMQALLSPSLADAKTMLVFLLWNIPLWAALLYFFPWNVFLAGVILLEWLVMAFIAIPVLLLSVLLVTGYLLSISFNTQSLFFVFITWALLFLIIHTARRYNRGELKRYVIKLFS
jgi:hypothetical protein